jgi:hypothetical protein
MASSSAYIIGPAHYGPKIKRDYASPPNMSKYNKSMMGIMFLCCLMKRMLKKVWDLLLMMIGLVLGFFSSFSYFFMMPQCDFQGLCMRLLICTSKKFVAFKCISSCIVIVVIMY